MNSTATYISLVLLNATLFTFNDMLNSSRRAANKSSFDQELNQWKSKSPSSATGVTQTSFDSLNLTLSQKKIEELEKKLTTETRAIDTARASKKLTSRAYYWVSTCAVDVEKKRQKLAILKEVKNKSIGNRSPVTVFDDAPSRLKDLITGAHAGFFSRTRAMFTANMKSPALQRT